MKTPVHSKVKAVAVSGATVAALIAILGAVGVQINIDPQTIADNTNALIAAVIAVVTVINTVAGWWKTERVGSAVVNVGDSSDSRLSDDAQAGIERKHDR